MAVVFYINDFPGKVVVYIKFSTLEFVLVCARSQTTVYAETSGSLKAKFNPINEEQLIQSAVYIQQSCSQKMITLYNRDYRRSCTTIISSSMVQFHGIYIQMSLSLMIPLFIPLLSLVTGFSRSCNSIYLTSIYGDIVVFLYQLPSYGEPYSLTD